MVLVVRSNFRTLLDLKKKHIVTDVLDSPQTRLVPLYTLQEQCTYNYDLVKPVDTGIGEIYAMKSILLKQKSPPSNTIPNTTDAAIVSSMMHVKIGYQNTLCFRNSTIITF
jgi:hypothetical protein